MSKGTIDLDYLYDIADAIREKKGVTTLFMPEEMKPAILSIPTGGITPTGTVNITQNGTHDVAQYASANVNVQPTLQSKTVTQNGTVTPDQGYDGLSEVIVNVSGGGGGGGILQPVNYDANNGYVNYGKWFKDTSGNYYCDCYEVEANHRYALCWGARSSSSSQTYAAFFLTNPIEADAFTSGTQIYNSTSTTQYYCISPAYKAPNNGFIVMQKSQAGESGITSYCIDLGLGVS